MGSGAFATVWLAYDEHLDSPVAVKVLADNWSGDPQVRRRFLEEGRYLRRVESPHVVSVYDAGELDDGRPYLVMSYADQGTLAERLETGGLTTGLAMSVLRQVARGLQTLHDRDVLHRDVKPANVLFRTVDGQVRAMLGDLGLGKALDVSSRLTMVAGTPSYVAPEQARAQTPDARADQYSLGALAYLLLSGRPAYTHTSLQQAARPEPPPPLGTDERPYDDAVDAVVRRALALDREERWPDVTGFVRALDEALGEPHDAAATEPWLPVDPELTQAGAGPSVPGEQSSLPDPVGPRRRRWPAVVAAAVVCAAAGVGGVFAGDRVAEAQQPSTVSVTDDSGTLGVEVPADWDVATGTAGWTPPTDDSSYPALSVGTSAVWTDPDLGGDGVFVGLLPGTDLPDQMPGHPECSAQSSYSGSTGTASRTVVHTGCPDGVVVERVVQIAADRLLWVQVRSPSTAVANRVLDSVATYGI